MNLEFKIDLHHTATKTNNSILGIKENKIQLKIHKKPIENSFIICK